jgi:probable rRNA maturation factor
MPLVLTIRNRQKTRAVDARLLRRITRVLLGELLERSEADLGVFIVAAPEMTRLNETFLRHAGSTDVITFDYSETPTGSSPPALHGEIFVCVDEAVAQARRFRASWEAELVRYVVHGVLHLCGFDDTRPAARRAMKQAENRLLRKVIRRFALRNL